MCCTNGPQEARRRSVSGMLEAIRPDHAARVSEEVGGARRASTSAMLKCPQLVLAIGKGDVEQDVEAPIPCMVEAKRKAEWPPQGQATQHECGPDRPDRSPQKVPPEHDPNVLEGTGTCKPGCRPTTLRSADAGHLEGRGKMRWIRGSLPLANPGARETPCRGHRTENENAGILAR